jgi:hypothetical protein
MALDSLQSAFRNTSIYAAQRESLRLIVQIYFDESGKFHDTDFICLCGFLATDSQWSEFNKAWSALLDRHHFPFIHLTQFYSQCRQKDWDEMQANRVLEEFIDVIRSHVHSGFAVGLDAKHWVSRFRSQKTSLKDPALFCIHRVLKTLATRFAEENHPGFLSLLFDDDQNYSLTCHKIIARLRREKAELRKLIISIAFCEDDYFTPIQAADVFANLTSKYFRDESGPASGPPQGPLARLLTSHVPGYSLDCRQEYWDAEEIDKHWRDILRAGI